MSEPTIERIRATGITVAFGRVDVVSAVDLSLKAGEIHAITGENGAGKSSLAKAIAGVYRFRSGFVELDGQRVNFKNPREALAAGVALIHQEPLTFPDLEVSENIFAGHYLRRGVLADRASCRSRARDLLASLGSDLSPTAAVSNLSVAQRQLVELASALAYDAKVWIFDETTAPLTPKEVAELFVVMRRLRDRGCALAMVSHHLHEVLEISDRITVLRDGIKVAELETAHTSPEEVVRLMVERDESRLTVESCFQPISGASNLDDDCKSPGTPAQFAPLTALPCVGRGGLIVEGLSGPGFRDVSLSVAPGEILGVAGLVGAGRTELTRALFGITGASAGSITIDGKAVKINSPQDAMKLGIALVPEDRVHEGLMVIQSIAFNSTLANLRDCSRGGFVLDGLVTQITKQFAERLNLAYRRFDQPVSQLSGGNQQKVVLAKWLSTNPKILLLDEPTRGVDVGAKQEVHDLIRELASQGMAVLMVSSDLKEIMALSDRIAVMRGGTITSTVERTEATEEAIMRAATQEEACAVI